MKTLHSAIVGLTSRPFGKLGKGNAMLRHHRRAWIGLLALVVLGAGPYARADVVTDANAKAAAIASRHPSTPISVRMMAIVQVSVFEATTAITGRYPTLGTKLTAAPGASVDAAVAAATRTALLKLMPAQQAAIEADYQAALKTVPDGSAKTAGVATGEQAATAVLASCDEDGWMAPNTYRPHTTPGVYVPTFFPVVPHWGKRKPWVMTSGEQFRPGPPPSLTSDTWKRDLAEIKALGGKNSTQRTPEQTAIAQFWEATAPDVYWPVARSVAVVPGRDVTDNARLLALAAMAMDDALIAVFDAKYFYNFWRPVTAIRNDEGDARASGLDAVHRHADAPRVPVRPLHRVGLAGRGARIRDRLRSVAEAEFVQLDGGRCRAHLEQRRRLRAGGRRGADLRRRALPILDGGRHGHGKEGGRARGAEDPQGDSLTSFG